MSQEKLEYLKLLEEKVRRQEGLPHIYGWKFYKWAREYFETDNRFTILCSANQIGKSTVQWRKIIHLATATDLWPKLWHTPPRQFWILYPTRDVAHIEFMTKIKHDWMPRGEYKDHPQYGWRAELYHNRLFAIHFNSGVTLLVKSYKQDPEDLQSGSVHLLAMDEEPPEEIMGELFMRTAATDGMISAAFTPTTGQEYWRLIIEERGRHEKFKDAWKRQISMHDCMEYEDGTPSHWTREKINKAINSCKSDAEIQCRVYGRFITAENLKYPSFHPTYNRKPAHHIPKDWSIWMGVDIGSGGDGAHPSAIVMVAVSPDYTKGRVFNAWRGDGVITDAAFVVNKAIEMSRGYDNIQIYYDWACRDFLTISQQMGLHVEAAEKSHEIGSQVVNVLFRNRMLYIYQDENNPALEALDLLSNELKSIKTTTPKNKAKDDLSDALRYAVTKIPWDWSAIRSDLVLPVPAPKETPEEAELKHRREFVMPGGKELLTIEEEFDHWNELSAMYE